MKKAADGRGNGERLVSVEDLSAALRAELESFRQQHETSLRIGLDSLRESIREDVIAEIRSSQTNKRVSVRQYDIERPAERAVVVEQAVGEKAEEAESASAALLRQTSFVSESQGTSTLAKVVMSSAFDNIASLMVFCSVIFLAVQTDYMARNYLLEAPYAFKVVESLFCIIFVVELALRLVVYGVKGFFCDKNKKLWNIFDLSLVSMQVLELVLSQIIRRDSGRFPFAPYMRILRTARMVRVTRFLRVVPELRTLIVQMFHSFLPLMWVFVLVFLVTAVFAVILTQVVTEFKVAEEEEYSELKHLHMFDNLFMSMLALYQTISDGKHWGELSEPLMDINPSLALLFIAYTFFVIFAFMNVVTSHFVEEAIESAKQDERQQMLEKLEDVFSGMDTGDGKSVEIDETQFLSLCETENMREYLQHLYGRKEVTAADVQDMKLFRLLDIDDSGNLSAEELVRSCERLTRSPTVLDINAFRQLFVDSIQQLDSTLKEIRKRT